MNLTPGSRLGPYEVVSSIGAGGMGEVYRARDTRLGRDVAIKLLPPAFAADSDRLRRFEQEARTVGSLNHSNLVTLFDVGSHAGRPYLVMELLEGETLRQKMAGKPLPAKRAVEIARAAAEGLSATHERGVIHRDLKPENLFVTRDGRVKILDFGLAKLRNGTEPQQIQPDDQPTRATSPCGAATDAGMVLGTVGYMSPEQVRCESLDSRSDIFALGIILWEMLTWDRPFKGPSAVECMSAILKDEPPDLDPALKLPPVLERIVHTCLAKDPGARFHSAHDLAFALENLSSGSYSLPHSIVSRPRRRRMLMVLGSMLAALLISSGILTGWALRGSPQNLPTFRKLTFGRGAIDGARFVPGSHDIAYSARWQGNSSTVFLLREGRLEPRALEARAAMLLCVSARGDAAILTEPALYTAMFTGTASVLPLAGGGTREVSRSAFAADFADDGSSLCLVSLVKSNLFQLEWPQGEVLLPPGTSPLRNPRIRGTQVAYFQSMPATVAVGEIRVMDRGSQPRTLTRCKGFTSLAWGPDGKEIWFSTFYRGESQIRAVSLQGGTRLLARHPGLFELVDVDPAGRCLAIMSSQLRQTFGRAPGAEREVDLVWLDAQTPSGLRADGSQVLLARSEDWELSDHVGLYLRSLSGGPATHLGTGSLNADLSPDGKWVATFETNDQGQAGIRLIPTGAGASRWYPLTGAAAKSDALWFHPLGGTIDLMEEDTNSLSRLDLATGAVSSIAYSRPVGTAYGQYPRSPDGRRMLLADQQTSAESDDSRFKFMLFEGAATAPRLAKGNLKTEVAAGWTDNNQEVYLYDRNKIPAQVFRWNPLTGARRPLFQITPSDPSGVWGIRNLEITPSGHAYVYSVMRKLSDLYLIEGLK